MFSGMDLAELRGKGRLPRLRHSSTIPMPALSWQKCSWTLMIWLLIFLGTTST